MGSPKFPRAAFEKGRSFLETKARPLEIARLVATLGGDPHHVIDALTPYQNTDGGFGHGIEPDLRTPLSTAIATSVGFQVLKAVSTPYQHAIVRRAVNWLLAKLDRERFIWPILTPAAVQAPHAPWWSFDADMDARWNFYRYNPSAELFGALCHFSALVPEDLLAAMTSDFFWRLKNSPPAAIYDLYCCLRLYESANLPESLREPLANAIKEAAQAQDPESFHVNYFELVPAKTSLLYPLLAPQLERAVERAIETQDEDGGWSPAWNWAEADAAAWAEAARDWRAVLTRTVLQTVHRHALVD